MQIAKYTNKKHFQLMCSWLQERNSYIPSKAEMPKTGFVAIDDNKEIAMGFLRLVEGGYAQLDGLVTNPKASSLDRHLAIGAVVTAILKSGKDKGIKAITAYSTHDNILNRSKAYGFKPVEYSIIVMNLMNEQGNI